MSLRPELERLAQEYAIRHDQMNQRHDAESTQFWADWHAALERLGADGAEAANAFFQMMDEAFPRHNETRHRHYQEAPDNRSGRRAWYREHPEFKDEFADWQEGSDST